MRPSGNKHQDAVLLRPLYIAVAVSPLCLLTNTPLYPDYKGRPIRDMGLNDLAKVSAFRTCVYKAWVNCSIDD